MDHLKLSHRLHYFLLKFSLKHGRCLIVAILLSSVNTLGEEIILTCPSLSAAAMVAFNVHGVPVSLLKLIPRLPRLDVGGLVASKEKSRIYLLPVGP